MNKLETKQRERRENRIVKAALTKKPTVIDGKVRHFGLVGDVLIPRVQK